MKPKVQLTPFAWPRDASGYEIVRDERTPEELAAARAKAKTLLDVDYQLPVIRSKGGREIWSHPREEFAPVHRDLAQVVKTDAEIVNFCLSYGLLFAGTPVKGDPTRHEIPLDSFYQFQRDLGTVLAAVDNAEPQRAAEIFNAMTAAQFTLVIDPRRPIINFTPNNLATYLLLLTAEEVTGGLRWRACANCGTWMDMAPNEVGRRRRSARYCSDNCRVEAHRARKAKEAAK
jgi:hypothetical protein